MRGLSVFLSIMAGRTIGGMRAMLGADARDRARHAEHAGRGAAGRHRGLPRHRRRRRRSATLCEALLRAIGEVAWVEDEELLDPVTAVSGSGPAYVFLLAELLERAALEQGSRPTSRGCWRGRRLPAPARCWRPAPEDAAALRQAVTSPGGTTEACAQRVDGRGGLAGGAEPRGRRGDQAVSRTRGLTSRARSAMLAAWTTRSSTKP